MGHPLLHSSLTLEKPLNAIGSIIGHELIHIDDLLWGNVYDEETRNKSEIRAYDWQRRTASDFNYGIDFRTQMLEERRKYE